ncbi:hypothetical protein H0H93_007369 [Arthromyces matolae]|nr:hypothetical protein H0H93_007369 [Arthromyces matolae]
MLRSTSVSSTSESASASAFSFSTSSGASLNSHNYTSEEQPDLGAFRTVLREWTYLQPPLRIPNHYLGYSNNFFTPATNSNPISQTGTVTQRQIFSRTGTTSRTRTRTQSQTEDGRRSTVWAYEPIAQYLADAEDGDTEDVDDVSVSISEPSTVSTASTEDTARTVQIETITPGPSFETSTSTELIPPSTSASVVDDYTLTLRTQPSPDEFEFDFEPAQGNQSDPAFYAMDSTESEELDKVPSPSLGYLEQALSFLAAERAQLAARKSVQGIAPGDGGAWRHVVASPQDASTSKIRKRRKRTAQSEPASISLPSPPGSASVSTSLFKLSVESSSSSSDDDEDQEEDEDYDFDSAPDNDGPDPDADLEGDDEHSSPPRSNRHFLYKSSSKSKSTQLTPRPRSPADASSPLTPTQPFSFSHLSNSSSTIVSYPNPPHAHTHNILSSSDSPFTSTYMHTPSGSKKVRKRTRVKGKVEKLPIVPLSSHGHLPPTPAASATTAINNEHAQGWVMQGEKTLTHARSVPSIRNMTFIHEKESARVKAFKFKGRLEDKNTDKAEGEAGVEGDNATGAHDQSLPPRAGGGAIADEIDATTRRLVALSYYMSSVFPGERHLLKGVSRKMVVQAQRRAREKAREKHKKEAEEREKEKREKEAREKEEKDMERERMLKAVEDMVRRRLEEERRRQGQGDDAQEDEVKEQDKVEGEMKTGGEGDDHDNEDGKDEDDIDPRGRPPVKEDPPVHIFIDHSNILFGLLTYLKRHPELKPLPLPLSLTRVRSIPKFKLRKPFTMTTTTNTDTPTLADTPTIRNRVHSSGSGSGSWSGGSEEESKMSALTSSMYSSKNNVIPDGPDDGIDESSSAFIKRERRRQIKHMKKGKETVDTEIVVPRVLNRTTGTPSSTLSTTHTTASESISSFTLTAPTSTAGTSTSTPTPSPIPIQPKAKTTHRTPIPLPSFATALSSPAFDLSSSSGKSARLRTRTKTKLPTRSRSRKARKVAHYLGQAEEGDEQEEAEAEAEEAVSPTMSATSDDVLLFSGVGPDFGTTEEEDGGDADGDADAELEGNGDHGIDVDDGKDNGKSIFASDEPNGIKPHIPQTIFYPEDGDKAGSARKADADKESPSGDPDTLNKAGNAASEKHAASKAELKPATATARKPKSKPRPRHLSHAALALLLERGRAVSKRVVVTSSPLYQPMNTLERLGYEVRVFMRVPDLGDGMDRTAKKLKAQEHKRHTSGGTTSGDGASPGTSPLKSSTMPHHSPRLPYSSPHLPQHSPSASTSGMSPPSASMHTAPPTPPRVRYREQGVDELLQLKLHQALAATDNVPPGATIVLATGDGNVGQFNEDGFLGPVRTALKRGWRVELYAWEDGLSRAWRREFGAGSEWAKKGMFQIFGMEQFAASLVEGGL